MAAAGVAAGAVARPGARTQARAYTLENDPLGKVLKTAAGRTAFVYMTKRPDDPNFWANSTCCFHPLFTPAGERLTDFAPGDHHHHRGVFLAWHSMTFKRKADFSALGPLGPTHGFDINRADFWGWGQFAPIDKRVITNRDVKLVNAEAKSAQIEIVNDWTIEGQKYLGERTTVSWREDTGAHVLDLTYQLTPDWDLTLDRTAFGGFCVRARNDGESWYSDASGKVTRPDPHYSAPDLNWPAADWYAFSIKLKTGKEIGCAVINHASNPPTTWHNPRYVWMVNPTVVAERPVDVAQGKTLTLKYRVVVFDGALPTGLVRQLSSNWKNS
jgi:Family of unknown function (DUF6807)